MRCLTCLHSPSCLIRWSNYHSNAIWRPATDTTNTTNTTASWSWTSCGHSHRSSYICFVTFDLLSLDHRLSISTNSTFKENKQWWPNYTIKQCGHAVSFSSNTTLKWRNVWYYKLPYNRTRYPSSSQVTAEWQAAVLGQEGVCSHIAMHSTLCMSHN